MATKKLLGYGGSASVAGAQVLVTSGSFDEARTVSYLDMINTPQSSNMVGRVQHADGVSAYSGSLSFDVHEGSMNIFSTSSGLLKRFYEFDVGINDGVYDWKMSKCKVSSISLAGSVGGLVTANLSFMAKSGRVVGSTPNAFLRDAILIGYWYTGTGASDNVKDWNLTMSQDVSLEYSNEDTMEPDYIKVGGVSYTMNVTGYTDLFPGGISQSISIGTSSFTLTGRPVGRGFSFGGITDVGSYSYTFETSSQDGSSDALVIN
jgi:hypothetical protein